MYSAFYYQLGNNMEQNQQKKTKKTPFYKRKFVRMTYMIVVHLFAIAGAAIIGAWAIYKLGLTNNSGAVDRNDRYLAEIATLDVPSDSLSIQLADADRMLKLAVINKAFPVNGRIIWEASKYCENPNIMDKMIAAAEVYVYDNAEYTALKSTVTGFWCMLLLVSLKPSFSLPLPTAYLVFIDAWVLKLTTGPASIATCLLRP